VKGRGQVFFVPPALMGVPVMVWGRVFPSSTFIRTQAARILADEFAVGLDESTVEICKAAALERWEAEEEQMTDGLAESRGVLMREHRVSAVASPEGGD